MGQGLSHAAQRVEGANGYLKDPTNTNLESAGCRRIRGIAAVHFLVGFQLAASHLRKHAAGDMLTQPTPQRQPGDGHADEQPGH